jgi:hypothetical protein
MVVTLVALACAQVLIFFLQWRECYWFAWHSCWA